ncbi:hypothetical protein GCM10022243_12660 [Saccharothrix violaceirubra]|uniref:Uncharacterized protein n=1 Tax=Saccharothrix violaceirubra TaxID=413306 RepID=A0A7W7WYP4_9PSEU|nr:hypothetical protein [Saccharothrix violaceirubra]MBB4968764.1 hypothetical protein [Saccharothrix violaceirubra]
MSTDAPNQPQPQYPQQPFQQQPQFNQAPAAQVPQEPKKRGVLGRILSALIGIAVVAAVGYGIKYFTSDAAQTKAGDCASLTGTTSKPEYKTVDCGAAEANYIVGKALNTSEKCDGDYDEYIETGRGPQTRLCLVPKLEEGKCYNLQGSTMGYPAVACGGGGDVLKLVKQVKDVADTAQCDFVEGALAFQEPKLTLCFEPTEGA